MEPTASIFAFVKELDDFSCELSCLDRVWNVLFPDKGGKWHHLHVNKYKHTFYITHVTGDGGLEVEPKKGVQPMDSLGVSSCRVENHDQPTTAWEPLIKSARKWLNVVRKEWKRCACFWRSTRQNSPFPSPIQRAFVNGFWLKTISA